MAIRFVIRGEGIQLDQLLKASGLVDSGGAAKGEISAGQVLVDGKVEMRKRAQLKAGQVVEFGGERVELAAPAKGEIPTKGATAKARKAAPKAPAKGAPVKAGAKGAPAKAGAKGAPEKAGAKGAPAKAGAKGAPAKVSATSPAAPAVPKKKKVKAKDKGPSRTTPKNKPSKLAWTTKK